MRWRLSNRAGVPVALVMLVGGSIAAAGGQWIAGNQWISVGNRPSLTELWEEPSDIDARDLFFGPWGSDHAPDPHASFTFKSPKKHGTSPGMVVTDARGREWHVKQGREGQPEVVVSRILSAVGYHQPPVYYVPSFSVVTAHGLSTERGGRFRLTMSHLRHAGSWKWEECPFIGTPPYQGLLVILVMLNSADLKNANNAFYLVDAADGARRWFVVRDLGTSLGDTARYDPVPNDLTLFGRHRFITGIAGGYVRFDYHAVHREVLSRITPGEVRWASRLLQRLTLDQWFAAFRAAGYPDSKAAPFIERIRQRIDQGLRVGSS
jgi:hypothetical protein